MFKCRYGHYYYYYPDLKDCCPLVGPPLLCGVLCLLFKDSLTLSLFQKIVISGTQQTLRYCFISCCVSLLIYSGRRESGKEVNTVKEACVWSGEAKVCCWLQSLFFLLVRKQAQRRKVTCQFTPSNWLKCTTLSHTHILMLMLCYTWKSTLSSLPRDKGKSEKQLFSLFLSIFKKLAH